MACRGIHDRYKAKRQGPNSNKEGSYGIYRAGMKRCKPCGVFYDLKDLARQNLSLTRCVCCRRPLKSRPNNRRFRDKMEVKVVA